jgi:hypothetical protein
MRGFAIEGPLATRTTQKCTPDHESGLVTSDQGLGSSCQSEFNCLQPLHNIAYDHHFPADSTADNVHSLATKISFFLSLFIFSTLEMLHCDKNEAEVSFLS